MKPKTTETIQQGYVYGQPFGLITTAMQCFHVKYLDIIRIQDMNREQGIVVLNWQIAHTCHTVFPCSKVLVFLNREHGFCVNTFSVYLADLVWSLMFYGAKHNFDGILLAI